MALSSKDLAIKYHSLEYETWVENGSNFISIVAGEYEFNSYNFQNKHQLFEYILNTNVSDVLIVSDNTVEPGLIAELMATCKTANMSRIAIKNTYGYGK